MNSRPCNVINIYICNILSQSTACNMMVKWNVVLNNPMLAFLGPVSDSHILKYEWHSIPQWLNAFNEFPVEGLCTHVFGHQKICKSGHNNSISSFSFDMTIIGRPDHNWSPMLTIFRHRGPYMVIIDFCCCCYCISLFCLFIWSNKIILLCRHLILFIVYDELQMPGSEKN